jgi:hypothetical protein
MSAGRCKVKVSGEMGHWRGFLCHDPVVIHSALTVLGFLACNGMTFVSHPLYSPDVAPCDFLVFEIQVGMEGKQLMQEQVQAALEDSWTENISKCVNSDTVAELTLLSYKDTTLKGIA